MAEKEKISPELLAVISEMQKSNQEALLAAIKEMKKPDEETQRKLDEDKKRKLSNAVAVIIGEMEGKLERARWQKQCPHKKPDGFHQFVATVLTCGDAVATCQGCQKTYRWRASTQEMAQGLNLQDKNNGHICDEVLSRAEKNSPPKFPNKCPDYDKLKEELEAFKKKHGVE